MSTAERLEGKVAIITGGASGMGKASVERFLAEGATVIAADLSEDGLAALDIPQDRGMTAVVDVTDEAAVRDLVDRVVERYGRVDVYFNNAGTAQWSKP